MFLILVLAFQPDQSADCDGVVAFHGQIAVTQLDLEFRPCNQSKTYLASGGYAPSESIEQLLKLVNSARSRYVRFTGEVERVPSLEIKGWIRDRDTVEILQKGFDVFLKLANHELVEVYRFIHITDRDYLTKDAEEFERQLHGEFEHFASLKPGARGTEWFATTPALLSEIEQIAFFPESAELPRFIGEPIGD